MNTLRPVFKHRIISRYGDISGSTRSPDYDFFLWGYLKSKVFQIRPADLHDLTDRVYDEISAIRPAMLLRVMKSVLNRYCYLPLAAGSSNGVTNTRCCGYSCMRS